jgi:hypothetical protein
MHMLIVQRTCSAEMQVFSQGVLRRWWVLRGTALGGRVEWEETWWESSDWSGMREMGAQKAGARARACRRATAWAFWPE